MSVKPNYLPIVLQQIVRTYLHKWETAIIDGEYTPDGFVHACAAGWFEVISRFTCNTELGLRAAARAGHAAIVRMLDKKLGGQSAEELFEAAIQSGSDECVQLCMTLSQHLVRLACQYGHKHLVLKYITKYSPVSTCMYSALTNGHIGLMKYMILKGAIINAFSIHSAIHFDQLLVAKVLYRQGIRTEEMPFEHIKSLSMLLWCASQAEITSTPFLMACHNNNLPMIAISTMISEVDWDNGIEHACDGNAFAAIKYICARAPIDPAIILSQARNLEITRYAINAGAIVTQDAFNDAALLGYADKFIYLYDLSPSVLNISDTVYSFVEGCSDFEKTETSDRVRIMQKIIKHGSQEALQHLQENIPDTGSQELIAALKIGKADF